MCSPLQVRCAQRALMQASSACFYLIEAVSLQILLAQCRLTSMVRVNTVVTKIPHSCMQSCRQGVMKAATSEQTASSRTMLHRVPRDTSSWRTRLSLTRSCTRCHCVLSIAPVQSSSGASSRGFRQRSRPPCRWGHHPWLVLIMCCGPVHASGVSGLPEHFTSSGPKCAHPCVARGRVPHPWRVRWVVAAHAWSPL